MSDTPEPPVPVSVLREAVGRTVAASSIRATAHMVGMSKTAIVKFLQGAKPQSATMRKLLQWYMWQSATMDEGTATAAIAVLLNGYPRLEREAVRERLYLVLREAHAAAGRESPDWLKERGQNAAWMCSARSSRSGDRMT